MEMTNRGATRPAMGHQDHEMDMSREKRLEMLKMHHKKTLWVYWLLVIFGIWMIIFPLTVDYNLNAAQPSGGRTVWLPLSERAFFLKWSDMISGLILLVFGWRSLTPNRPVSLWLCCFVGIWLSFSPLLFWSPSAAAYMNDTLVGALVIGLAVLIPGMPNMLMYMQMGGDLPEGWSYNPSSWPQRWIMIVTGFLGWVVSRYLASYQLGYISSVWDPFFGSQSGLVLNSKMSQSLPVSDAGLGAFAYTFEFLMGWMGSSSRWRTMPWMVTFFGILVIPLGLVHIFLVMSQPIVVGHWCSFCLLAAAIMLPMIPLEVDEVIAMCQYIKLRMKKGEKFWKLFWKGGMEGQAMKDLRSPEMKDFSYKPAEIFKASIFGMSAPKALIICLGSGIWLMFNPNLFDAAMQSSAANLTYCCAASIIVVSVLAMGEVLRMGRWLNFLPSITLAIGIWLIPGASLSLSLSLTLTAFFVMICSIPRGMITETYGSWQNLIK